MRRTARLLGYALLSVFTLETVIAFIDWWARWDWFKDFMGRHPSMATSVRTPFSYLVLLALGFGFLFAERRVGLPRISARFVNSRRVPDLHTTTMQAVWDSENQAPGWDLHNVDWEWFIEVQLANESDTATTLEAVEASATVRRKWWKRPEKLDVQPSPNLGAFRIDAGISENLQPCQYEGPRYRPITSLIQEVDSVPLEKGIGHRGWIRLRLRQVNQRDMLSGKLKLRIWLVDALQGRHEVAYKKGSDRNWDKNFYIFEDKHRL